MSEKRKALVLLSGGLDSAVAAWSTRDKFDYKISLSFRYGQLHWLELEYAKVLSQMLGTKHIIIDMDMSHIHPTDEVGHLLKKNHLDQTAHQTTKDWTGQAVATTYVPGRNIIMLAYAGSICDAFNIPHIIGGWNVVDYSGYPDCRSSFISFMEKALSHGLRECVGIFPPLISHSKEEIIKIGLDCGVPFEYTWSCYDPRLMRFSHEKIDNYLPCQTCPSCKIRTNAWNLIGRQDPLLDRLTNAFRNT